MGTVKLFGRPLLALLLAGALTSGVAWAEPPRGGPQHAPPPGRELQQSRDTPAAGRAKVDVMVVYANHSNQVDPRAAELKRSLGSMGFTGFQVLSTHDAQLALQQSASFSVEGGRKVEVTLDQRGDQQARVRIEMMRDSTKVVDTTVSITRGRSFPIVAGKYQDGKLVFVVTVAY